MNPTDEVSISAMFAEAKTLNEMKEKTSAKYVNEKIRDYALRVMGNYIKVKSELLDAIAKNSYVLGEKTELPVEYALSGAIKNQIVFGDCKINIRCHLHDRTDFVWKSGYCGRGKIVVSHENIGFDDIWWNTSDTNDPDYKICSAWGLHNDSPLFDDNDRGRKLTLDEIEYGKFTEREWRQILRMAKWTESYTEKFCAHFRKFIESRIAILRSSVNKDLEAKKENDSANNDGTHTTTINITWTI